MQKNTVDTGKKETAQNKTLRGAARLADLERRVAQGQKKLNKQTNGAEHQRTKPVKISKAKKAIGATDTVKVTKPAKAEKVVKQKFIGIEGNTIKALSIHPMYAAAIAVGDKKEEYRTWQTSYRGDLLICASQYNDGWEFPRGYALCVVNLYDITWSDEYDCYAWQLKDVRPIMPFKYKGKLHLYDVDSKLVKFVSKPANSKLFDWWQYDLKIVNAPERKKYDKI